MPAIRVRTPFAASFGVLLLAAAYLGLSNPKIPSYGQSDKGLHFITFFLLTLSFYWILETSRRRVIHLTLLTCTAGLAIGSEIVQALLPNGRDFDPFDILANVVGSTLALLISSWYHKRMLERRRKNKHYDIVPGEEQDEDDDGVSGGGVGGGERDVELGEVGEQETGTVPVEGSGQAEAGATQQQGNGKGTDVTEELDNWDENEEDDWEAEGVKPGGGGDEDGGEAKKRVD